MYLFLCSLLRRRDLQRPITSIMTRYTPTSGSGLQDE
jgi:hypothetical protein